MKLHRTKGECEQCGIFRRKGKRFFDKRKSALETSFATIRLQYGELGIGRISFPFLVGILE
jgi:hypothetical protein